ncbi:hypothetical protein D3C78_1379040 [compost metagenome]
MNLRLPPVFSLILLNTSFSAIPALADKGKPIALPSSLFLRTCLPTSKAHKNIFDLTPPAEVPFLTAFSVIRSNRRGTTLIMVGFTSIMFLPSNSRL